MRLLFTKEGTWCLRDLGPCEITASTLRWEPRMMRICKGLAGQRSQVERGRPSVDQGTHQGSLTHPSLSTIQRRESCETEPAPTGKTKDKKNKKITPHPPTKAHKLPFLQRYNLPPDKDQTGTRLTIWGWRRHQNRAGNAEGVTESSRSPLLQKTGSVAQPGLVYLGYRAV